MGVTCTTLVDIGSNITLIQPDIVPVETALEPSSAYLKTVTGVFAPIKGKGGLSVSFHAWVADMQDPCVLGLDFLRAIGYVLDLGNDSLTIPDACSVLLTHPDSSAPSDTSKHALWWKHHPLVRMSTHTKTLIVILHTLAFFC